MWQITFKSNPTVLLPLWFIMFSLEFSILNPLQISLKTHCKFLMHALEAHKKLQTEKKKCLWLMHEHHFSSFQTNSGTPIEIPLPMFQHLFSFFNIFSPIIIISLIPFPRISQNLHIYLPARYHLASKMSSWIFSQWYESTFCWDLWTPTLLNVCESVFMYACAFFFSCSGLWHVFRQGHVFGSNLCYQCQNKYRVWTAAELYRKCF